jgi:hypothetical protein
MKKKEKKRTKNERTGENDKKDPVKKGELTT